MANVTSTSRPAFPSGAAVLESTSLSINIQSALVHGESDLHCYVESVTIELRTKTFLHCWDNQAVDTDGIEPGAEIFGGMMARACQGLPETEFQSAQFALLLHMSVKLSHRLELSAQRQSAFNHIIGNASMDFVQMQGAVFEFFDWKRSAMPKPVPVEQASAPVYPEIHPRFEDLPVKELKLPPSPPQAQPVKEQSKPPKKAVVLPELKLPEVKLSEFKLPKVTLPKIELPNIEPSKLAQPKRKAARLPSFKFPRIGKAAAKAVAAAKRGIYQSVSGVGSRVKNSFYIGPLNNAWQAAKRGILNGASDVATRLKSSFYIGPLNDAYQAVNRAAWLGKHAVMDAASAVARGAKGLWNGAKQLFSGYDRV